MTNSERSKILAEQADFLRSEAEKLKSWKQSRYLLARVEFSPDDLNALGDKLEAISNHVKWVADDIQANG